MSAFAALITISLDLVDPIAPQVARRVQPNARLDKTGIRMERTAAVRPGFVLVGKVDFELCLI